MASPAITGIKPTDDGYLYIDPAVFHADFAADLPKAKAAFMAESQVLISTDSFTPHRHKSCVEVETHLVHRRHRRSVNQS